MTLPVYEKPPIVEAALRQAPIVAFSAEDLGWEVAPKAAIEVRLAGARELDWHLEADELEL